jgi:hypothetical protein
LYKYFEKSAIAVENKKLTVIANLKNFEINTNISIEPESYSKFVDYFSKVKNFSYWIILLSLVILSGFMMSQYNYIWISSLRSLSNLMDSENYLL